MTTLYEHCTGTSQKSVNVYMIAYVSGSLSNYGEWVMDTQEFKTEAAAKKAAKVISKKRAINGQVSIRLMPKSKKERARLQKNICKF